MTADLVKCRFCGSLVSERRLEKHIKRVHGQSRSNGVDAEKHLTIISGQQLAKARDIEKVARVLEVFPKRGLKLLEKLERVYPSDPDVCFNKGVALLRLNRIEEAIASFQKTLRLDNNHKRARSGLKMAMSAMNMLSLYSNTTNDMKRTGKEVDEMGTVANEARQNGFLELALKMGEIMLKLDKEKFGALNDLGMTYALMRRYEKALVCYEGALEIKPDMSEALSNKALLKMMTHRLDEAFSLYERVVVLKPDFLQGWYHLGVISIESGKDDAAMKYLDRATELNDEYYLAWLAKYELLRRQGRLEEAKECSNKAIELNPEYAAEVLLAEGSGKGGLSVHTSHMEAKRER